MKDINIKVIPGAKRNKILQQAGTYKVYLTAHAVGGKANKALIVLLADYFKVRKSKIEITKGLKSRLKDISIEGI